MPIFASGKKNIRIMKKKYLVYIQVAASVVVDVPKDKVDNSPMRDDELFAIVADAAIEKIAKNPNRYLVRENVDEIDENW